MKAFLVLLLVAYTSCMPMAMPDYGWPQPAYTAVAAPLAVKHVVSAPVIAQPAYVKTVAPAATSYSTFTQSHGPQVVKVAQPVAYAQPVVKVAQPVAYAQPVHYVHQPTYVKQVVQPSW